MRLSELMSNMDLAFWPQVALVIFVTVFVGVLLRTFSGSQAELQEEMSRLPLEDGSHNREVS